MDKIVRVDSGQEFDTVEKPLNPVGETCWDIGDVARFLKVTPDTVREWRRHGYGPPARRAGRHLRWVPRDVHDWFRQLPLDTAA